MRVNFGRTIIPSAYGKHTLGRLECSGRSQINSMPESCDDLWQRGHTLNGFYLVKATNGMFGIYCDFDKMPGDQGIQRINYKLCFSIMTVSHCLFCFLGIQRLIGLVDIKSASVYFFAQARTIFNFPGSTIPFDAVLYNIGNGLDFNGTFTAPRSGNYYFSFNGLAGGIDTYVDLYLNDVNQGITAYASNTGYVMSLASMVFLNVGDRVELVLRIGMLASNSYNNFNGFFLEEKLSL